MPLMLNQGSECGVLLFNFGPIPRYLRGGVGLVGMVVGRMENSAIELKLGGPIPFVCLVLR